MSNIIFKNCTKNNIYNGFIYNLSDINYINNNIDFINSIIIYQGFLNIYSKNDVILPISGPYESNLLYLNLEGRYRKMRQVLKSNINLYTNYEIISILDLYKRKKNKVILYTFLKFNNIIKFFNDLLNFFCNFFLLLDDFFLEFFFFTGYISTKLYSKFYIICEPLLFNS